MKNTTENPLAFLAEPAKRMKRALRKSYAQLRPLAPKSSGLSQGESFAHCLTVEDSFETEMPGFESPVTVFLMKDRALGIGLWLRPIAHEVLEESELRRCLEGLSRTLSTSCHFGKTPGLSFQVILDVFPDASALPARFAKQQKGFAAHMAKERFEKLSNRGSLHESGGSGNQTTQEKALRLWQRRLLLTLRLEGDPASLRLSQLGNAKGSSDEALEAARSFAAKIQTLSEAAAKLRSGLVEFDFAPRAMNREELLLFFRDSLQSLSLAASQAGRHTVPSNQSRPLGEQAFYNTIEACSFGLGVGDPHVLESSQDGEADTWQVASLLELPETTAMGLFAKLLTLDVTHRVVVNLRPQTKGFGLACKRTMLTHARDAQGMRQREDLDALDERLFQEETLFSCSWQILVRNEGVPLRSLFDTVSLSTRTKMAGVLSHLSASLQVQFREENLCAPMVFAACLPLQNSPSLIEEVGREHLVLSRNAVSLLPLFGGFQGTPTPMLQMMSRGGNRIFLNPRDAQGASHVAILGGSGGGKSFLTANMVTSFWAAYPGGRVFIIDKKTSYGVLAQLSSEESSSTFLRPPETFPHIFQGGDGEDSLPAIVSLLHTAISLVSPRAPIEAPHKRVLSDAIRLTFAEKRRQAATRFCDATGEIESEDARFVSLPRLSEVLDNLEEACSALDFSKDLARALTEALSPFVGQGPYAKFFDAPGVLDLGAQAPTLTLCDLDGVASDPTLMVLTVQALIMEIARLVRPVDEHSPNPPSLLIVEEVGVLAGESPALVSFIQDAWKTMRKFGVTCVGVTNSVADYTDKPGPKEIWDVSPNKIILNQPAAAVEAMATRIREGKNGLVRSLFECELLASLKMVKGQYADGLWLGETCVGTYSYVPTGFDYWCAASDPIERATVSKLALALKEREFPKPFFSAVDALAQLFPKGLREGSELRALTPEETEQAIAWALSHKMEGTPDGLAQEGESS